MTSKKTLSKGDRQGLQASQCLSFYRAFKRLSPLKTPGEALLVPAIMCGTFSIELGLKVLLSLEEKDSRGHDIEKLLNKLGEKVKTKILSPLREKWVEFDSELKDIARAFTTWRYIYEKDGVFTINFKFLDALLTSIVGLVSERLNIRVTPDAEFEKFNTIPQVEILDPEVEPPDDDT